MWLEKVFYSKAKSDRVRYLDELRTYLSVSYDGNIFLLLLLLTLTSKVCVCE